MSAGAIAAACARPPLAGVGRATDHPTTGASAPTANAANATAPQTVSPIAADFATHMAHLGSDSFVATGHAGGRYAATVYITAASKELAEASKELPVGTQVVMKDIDRASHVAGPTFYMEKAATGWRFGVVETPDAKPEDVALCARCHAEAQHDFVFALP